MSLGGDLLQGAISSDGQTAWYETGTFRYLHQVNEARASAFNEQQARTPFGVPYDKWKDLWFLEKLSGADLAAIQEAGFNRELLQSRPAMFQVVSGEREGGEEGGEEAAAMSVMEQPAIERWFAGMQRRLNRQTIWQLHRLTEEVRVQEHVVL